MMILLLLALSPACGAFRVRFNTPVLVGTDIEYADSFWGISGGTNKANLASLGIGGQGYWSNDGGSTWKNDTSVPGIGIGSPVSLSENTLHGYGTYHLDPTKSFLNITTMNFTQWSVGSDGFINGSIAPGRLEWNNFPKPITCKSNFGGCPFRLQGGDVVFLEDTSTFLYSVIVYWGGNGEYSTSVVAFSSMDGLKWKYLSTIADASSYPSSEEGPNENTLAMLTDGTVICVIRLDAGDGPETHPYKPYYITKSSDNGKTWSTLVSMKTLGSARPKLLQLAPTGPLLLSGGRARFRNTSDVLLWVNDAGDAGNFVEYSISYHHNLLAQSEWLFTPNVNSTTYSPRETTSYTSMIRVPPPSDASTSILITYNRYLPNTPKLGFAMRVDFLAT